MCGIAGYLAKKNRDIDTNLEEIRKSMIEGISYRGVDDAGQYEAESERHNVFLSHSRLAIIDLDSGSQPMSKDGVTIVFNGEIYNYQLLRQQLILEGSSFFTHSDTEVVLELFLKHGPDAFKYLDGMYAFALYETTSEKLYIHRDSFGEKPLYLVNDEAGFYFASDINAIPKRFKQNLNLEAIELYFGLTYIPAPYSIYVDVIKSLPSQLHVISNNSYESKLINKISTKHSGQDIHKLMQKSVDLCLTADVEVGCFLSGGIDSAIVAFHAVKRVRGMKAFTLAFENKNFDELKSAAFMAKRLGMEHKILSAGGKELAEVVDEAVSTFSEPFADPSLIPSYLITRYASGFTKVVLTGDGGDEVFAGYRKYQMVNLNRFYTRLIPRKVHSKLAVLVQKHLTVNKDKRGLKHRIRRFFSSVSYDGYEYLRTICMAFKPNEFTDLFQSPINSSPQTLFRNFVQEDTPTNITECRLLDRRISLEGDMLVKMDRLGMRNQIETRAPFLREFLWDYSIRKRRLLMLLNMKKIFLRLRYVKHLGFRYVFKRKRGFGAPVGDLLRTALKSEMEGFMDAQFVSAQGIFRLSFIRDIWQRHLDGTEDNTYKLWTYYCFQKWYVNYEDSTNY